MKNLKKKLILLLAVALLPLVFVGTVIGVIDPFFVYHAPLDNAYYVIDNQLEQNPGIAKHFDYDSVMLGSSMTTNFDTNLFNEKLGCEMVKLSYNAAYPEDIERITEIVVREKEELAHAFLCIDIANYMYEPGTLSYAYPEHLYDDNVLNDLKYLLNKEVFFDYVLDSYLGKKKIVVNEIYWHWQYMTYSREQVLANYSKPQIAENPSGKYSMENLKENLESSIIPYIEATPDTRWHVFFPPYSMLYWYDSLASKEADLRIEGMAYITEQLLKYPNVEIHYFQDCEEWITNLDSYTDVTHFSKEITDEMMERLCEGMEKVSVETYKERLAVFREFVENYDYEVLFEAGKEAE